MTTDELFENRDKLRALIAESELYIETTQRRIAKRAKKLAEFKRALLLTEDALQSREANRQPGAPSIFEGRETRSNEAERGREEGLQK